jgi:hypothetical protein
LYALVGLLFNQKNPFPFGGDKKNPGYLKYNGSNTAELLYFISYGAAGSLWQTNSDRAFDVLCKNLGEIRRIHLKGEEMKDPYDDLVLKGLLRSGHLKDDISPPILPAYIRFDALHQNKKAKRIQTVMKNNAMQIHPHQYFQHQLQQLQQLNTNPFNHHPRPRPIVDVKAHSTQKRQSHQGFKTDNFSNDNSYSTNIHSNSRLQHDTKPIQHPNQINSALPQTTPLLHQSRPQPPPHQLPQHQFPQGRIPVQMKRQHVFHPQHMVRPQLFRYSADSMGRPMMLAVHPQYSAYQVHYQRGFVNPGAPLYPHTSHHIPIQQQQQQHQPQLTQQIQHPLPFPVARNTSAVRISQNLQDPPQNVEWPHSSMAVTPNVDIRNRVQSTIELPENSSKVQVVEGKAPVGDASNSHDEEEDDEDDADSLLDEPDTPVMQPVALESEHSGHESKRKISKLKRDFDDTEIEEEALASPSTSPSRPAKIVKAASEDAKETTLSEAEVLSDGAHSAEAKAVSESAHEAQSPPVSNIKDPESFERTRSNQPPQTPSRDTTMINLYAKDKEEPSNKPTESADKSALDDPMDLIPSLLVEVDHLKRLLRESNIRRGRLEALLRAHGIGFPAIFEGPGEFDV